MDVHRYDAIVVGARVAGAPTAMLLARAGYRVLLLDRDRFPSDTISTHYIHQPGVAKLKQWGLLDDVLATGAPPIHTLTTVRAGIPLRGMPVYDGIDFALCPRRHALDTVLVNAAAAAGAEFREEFVVEDVLWEDGTVVGIRGHQKGGSSVEDRARIVVGADGIHSVIARAVQPVAYNTHPTMGCGYYGYFSGVPMDGAEVHYLDDCILFGFPTNDGETCIAVEWPASRFAAVKQDYAGAFRRALDQAPDFADRVAQGRRETRFLGTGDLPNYFRTPSGPGWALVGDAGYHKDPVTGLGITDAFHDAELLAQALDAGFAGRRSLTEALAGYEQQRNARAMPLYAFTIQSLAFQPPAPEQVMLYQALVDNQADTDRLLGMICGITPITEFMAPENLGRIIHKAQQRTVHA